MRWLVTVMLAWGGARADVPVRVELGPGYHIEALHVDPALLASPEAPLGREIASAVNRTFARERKRMAPPLASATPIELVGEHHVRVTSSGGVSVIMSDAYEVRAIDVPQEARDDDDGLERQVAAVLNRAVGDAALLRTYPTDDERRVVLDAAARRIMAGIFTLGVGFGVFMAGIGMTFLDRGMGGGFFAIGGAGMISGLVLIPVGVKLRRSAKPPRPRNFGNVGGSVVTSW